MISQESYDMLDPNDPKAALARVQELGSDVLPAARCELQDYENRIGCGLTDAAGEVHDFRFVWRAATEDLVLLLARILSDKVED